MKNISITLVVSRKKISRTTKLVVFLTLSNFDGILIYSIVFTSVSRGCYFVKCIAVNF